MNTDTNILETLKTQLLSVHSSEWERIASECGVAKTLPRKIAYGDRKNPGVMTVQPLLTWFSKRAKEAA